MDAAGVAAPVAVEVQARAGPPPARPEGRRGVALAALMKTCAALCERAVGGEGREGTQFGCFQFVE